MQRSSDTQFFTNAEIYETPDLVADLVDTIRNFVKSVYGDLAENIFEDLRRILQEYLVKLIDDNKSEIISVMQLGVGNYADSVGIGGLDFKIAVRRRGDRDFLRRSDEKDSPSVCVFQPYAGRKLADVEFDTGNCEVTMIEGVLGNDSSILNAKNVPVGVKSGSKIKLTCVVTDEAKLDGSQFTHNYRRGRAKKGYAPVFFNRVLK